MRCLMKMDMKIKKNVLEMTVVFQTSGTLHKNLFV